MIVLDTNIFIYHLSSDSQFGGLAQKLFQKIEVGECKAIASFISYAEIMTLPATQKDKELMNVYRKLLLNFPNLEFYSVGEEVAYQAALIRGAHPALKLMDASILATAQIHKASVLLTEDKQLKIKNFPVPIKTLQEYFR